MSSEDRKSYDPEGLNTATPPVVAADSLITPVERFFTRSHAPAPAIDPATWRLEVDGLVDRPRTFSLAELRSFPPRTVTATLVCAGLRRTELLPVRPIPGELLWGLEPISTGRWSGISLSDVLRAGGVSNRARHVHFLGLDRVERHGHHFGFGGSIDLAKALEDDVLLATDLNGAPLPPAHGFPLRTIVPGWIGARCVKWLGRITLAEAPSDNYFQTKAYRVQREANPQDPRDVSAGLALTQVALNAVITHPTQNQILPAGPLQVQGWALGTEARPLTTIELSPNNGQTWLQPEILAQGDAWTWTFWQANLHLKPGQHTLIVRATDSTGASQPRDVAETWNVKGYANNAWHRVAVVVE